MNSKFKISIPKPCHENWNKMTPNEKGKFCSSCSKTVVDFTKKSAQEIQEYLIANKNNRVCGHFYKKQLDSIVIEIPSTTFQQQLSFQKLFILALFFVMGTTLFSCQYGNGDKQKIENIIIKDSLEIIEENIGLVIPNNKKLDSTEFDVSKDSIIEIVGELPILTVEGDIAYEEIEEEVTFGFIIIEENPRFKEDKNLSKKEAKESFDQRIKTFFDKNLGFQIAQNLGLNKGKYRIFTQFTIDENGFATDFKVRTPHPKLKKEVLKILEKLPQFIPGKQNDKIVKTKYTLPISFIVE